MTLENDPQPKATSLSVRDDHAEQKMRFSCQEITFLWFFLFLFIQLSDICICPYNQFFTGI